MEIAERRAQSLKWLLKAEPKDNEDRVFRLRSLVYLEADDEAIKSAAKELLDQQADDGGWSQTAEMQSDAYATGTAITTLHEAGQLSVSDTAYRKAAEYLAHPTRRRLMARRYTEQADSRVFESGFPHGKDQFISISATCWATTALLLACPISPR